MCVCVCVCLCVCGKVVGWKGDVCANVPEKPGLHDRKNVSENVRPTSPRTFMPRKNIPEKPGPHAA